eukprot:SAG22_NODE_71_length_22540_cov_8.918052_5_plen_338_part_00
MYAHTQDSNRLVEEFMLLANQSVAERIHLAFPDHAVLRRHQPPDPELIQQAVQELAAQGVVVDGSTAAALHASLERLRQPGNLEPRLLPLVVTAMTKPMKTAEYICTGDLADPATGPFGHYALGFGYYTHFTSPIRRYPDVMVHRLLQAALDLQAGENGMPESAPAVLGTVAPSEKIGALCKQCNERKNGAKKAQEASDKVYMCVMLTNRPVEEDAVVLELDEEWMQVFVNKYGIEKRVYFNDDDRLKQIEYRKPAAGDAAAGDAAAGQLSIEWAEAAGGGGGGGGERGQIELRALETVRVVMSARGVPMDYIVKLALMPGRARDAAFFAQQYGRRS